MKTEQRFLYSTEEEHCGKVFEVNESMEVYTCEVENEHDKIFKDILNDKEEARKFINKYLELEIPILKDKIELYNSSYITEAYRSKESDVVYKMKDKNIFFLIEHQSTIDLSMPYRMENYAMQIINTAIDKERIRESNYLYPKVIPIVLYTGSKKWKAKLSFSEVQEKLAGYKEEEKSYRIVDVNNYTKGKLLEDELFVTKVMLLEKSKTTKELIENAKEILKSVPEDKFNKMVKIIYLLLGKKVGEDETKKILDVIIEKGEEEDMLDVIERIEEREKRELEKSKKEGIKEGIREKTIEIAKNMIKEGCDIEFIYTITGLRKRKIEELLNSCE